MIKIYRFFPFTLMRLTTVLLATSLMTSQGIAQDDEREKPPLYVWIGGNSSFLQQVTLHGKPIDQRGFFRETPTDTLERDGAYFLFLIDGNKGHDAILKEFGLHHSALQKARSQGYTISTVTRSESGLFKKDLMWHQTIVDLDHLVAHYRQECHNKIIFHRTVGYDILSFEDGCKLAE